MNIQKNKAKTEQRSVKLREITADLCIYVCVWVDGCVCGVKPQELFQGNVGVECPFT